MRLLPLLLLVACEPELADWDGEGAFTVRAAWMASCTVPADPVTGDPGLTHTFAVAISGRSCSDHVVQDDVVTEDPCDALRDVVAAACDPEARYGASATSSLAFWLEGTGTDALKGATASSASLFRCDERKADVWTGETTTLTGTFEVTEVKDGVATVDVDAGGLAGTVEFLVCP